MEPTTREDTALKRFKKKFKKMQSGCWRWTAYIQSDGYGRFGFRGNMKPAHRVAYILYKGEIPSGFEINHICNRKNCVNPDHLELIEHGAHMVETWKVYRVRARFTVRNRKSKQSLTT